MSRIVIVEDVPWIRQSAEELLSSGGFDVVGAFDSVRAALDALGAGLVTDSALVDLHLPDGSGIDVIHAFRRLCPSAVVVAFTVLDDAATIVAALRAGARGYLLKSTAPACLAPLVREALDGGAPMSAPVARLVVDALAVASAPAPISPELAAEAETVTRLTPREKEVLVLLAKGLSYADVARVLGVGLGTIQGYVKTVYAKLEVTSKAEAAAVAARLGMV